MLTKKKCNGCGKTKAASEFYPRARKGVRANQLAEVCKECAKVRQREYQARKKRGEVKPRPKHPPVEVLGWIKRCGKCGIRRDGGAFHKNSASPDGRHQYCKKCRSRESKRYEERYEQSRTGIRVQPQRDSGQRRAEIQHQIEHQFPDLP